ncbi:hypothetical protein [Vallitalea okinawensis]|uniref:hypothetical protein n=1 Tax=Vallitalea okinawensis TaxID=2078660 RepID=UPI000CFBD04C|nr:hypothetical protein [Vallitalea okinawensis]
MADLRGGTTIGGNLALHTGNSGLKHGQQFTLDSTWFSASGSYFKATISNFSGVDSNTRVDVYPNNIDEAKKMSKHGQSYTNSTGDGTWEYYTEKQPTDNFAVIVYLEKVVR